jgi:hypothetical protein
VCTYCEFDKSKVEFEPQPHVHTHRMWVWTSGHDIISLSLFKCCREIRASQNFSSLTKFVENISNIYISK